MAMEGTKEQAAIYVRTATTSRAVDALAEQEAVCRALCAERGYALDPSRVYRDVGSGLALDDRGGLALLRDDVAARRVAVVVAVSPDRLSRDEAALAVLTQEAEASGVRVEYVNVPPALKFAGWPSRPTLHLAREEHPQ
jgi:DNA invertase Pin-like site-specific DNA recombinase